MPEEVLVLGAGFAGLRASLELAGKGYDVTLLDLNERHEFTPGIINALRKHISDGAITLDIEDFLEGTGVSFEQQAVTGIKPDETTVVTGSGERDYENLVVALGGEPRTFGMDVSDACGMYNLEAARQVEEKVEEGDTALIVGSGYVGMETAGELEEAGVEVKVVDQATRPMPNSPEKASQLVLDYIENRDIDFMGGRRVTEVEEKGVKTEDGGHIEADMVIWAGGVKAPDLVQESFDCDAKGVPVNAGLSSEEYGEVFAAGDCADTGVVKTAHAAVQQGELLAENLEKGEGESLEEYAPGELPLVVSLGKTGFFIYGDLVLRNWIFRRLKTAIRWKYFLGLRLAKLRARYF